MDIKEIRYINLRKNTIKRLLMELLLRKLKYPKEWVEGVVWDESKSEYRDLVKNGLEDYAKRESISRQKGIIGCWIAHTYALKDVRHDNGITVVLEDDFVCKKDFFDYALSMIRRFDRDFDVIIFDPSGTGPMSADFVGTGICKLKGHSYPYYFGSHCLFINNRSIQRILKIKEKSLIKDYDGFLLCNKEIDSYVFYTGKSKTVLFGSDISQINSLFILLRGLKIWFSFRKDVGAHDSMPFF